MTMASLMENFISTPLGFEYPDFILIILLAMSLLFFALGLRSGLILLWALLGLTYMSFQAFNMDTFHVLTIFLVVGVIMVVSLFISVPRQESGLVGL